MNDTADIPPITSAAEYSAAILRIDHLMGHGTPEAHREIAGILERTMEFEKDTLRGPGKSGLG